MDVLKILIIRFSSIGDIVLSSPVIRALRNKFPTAEIDFVVLKEFAELVNHNPNLTNVIQFDKTTGFQGLKQLSAKINANKYHIVIDLQNNIRSSYIRIRSNIKKRYIVNKKIFSRFFLTNFKLNFYRGYVSVVNRYLETAKELGVALNNAELDIFLPEDILSSTENKLKNYNLSKKDFIFGVAPSAKHYTKKWLPERYAELIAQLIDNYKLKVLLFGGKEDKKEIDSIVNAVENLVGNQTVINLAGELSLLESAAAFDYCNVVLTNDTGLMHLAAARKRKLVAVFGPTVKEFGFFPYGTESIVVENNILKCRPCSYHGSRKCPEKHFKCMKEINTERVYEAVKHILNLS